MRDFTKKEIRRLAKGRCPMCKQKDKGFRKGPEGGMSMNVFCNQCGAGLNVVMGFALHGMGQLIKEPDVQ